MQAQGAVARLGASDIFSDAAAYHEVQVPERELTQMRAGSGGAGVSAQRARELTINQYNENHIGSALSAGSLMDSFVSALSESMATSVEGVY